MKRFHLWFREFNLTQQLISLILVVISTFSVFFFVFLGNSVNRFVEEELFKLLHTSQNNMAYYITNNESSIKNYLDFNDKNIVHIVYDIPSNKYFSLDTNIDELPEEFIKTLSTFDGSRMDYIYNNRDVSILYSIKSIDDNTLLLSFIHDAYRSEFKNALANSIVNIIIFVSSILFIILTLWVSSLIHPLNLIRNYIYRIKNNEAAVLKIDRRDEIGEVAKAIVEMNDEIEKQNRIKEEMIQNISHDLKTPIATIKSYGESIKDGIYPYGSLDASVDVIIEHAQRLEKKVESLIIFNKVNYLLDDGSSENNLYMKDVIEKVIVSMKVVKPKINIKTNIEGDIYFHGEEEPWRIVIENLLDNALRYAKSSIEVNVSKNELTIYDDGPNIKEDVLKRLFKPYEKGVDGKFGLGLSIVKRIVNTYGYNISAENLNDGVLFRIIKN